MRLLRPWLWLPLLLVACAEAPPARPESVTNDAGAATAASAAPAGPYVVLPVEGKAIPLFGDERRVLQAKALDLIAAQGATVVKLDELDAFTTPEAACRATRTFDDRVRARYGRAPQVHVTASCAERPCTIVLAIVRPGEGDAAEPLDTFETRVDAPDSLAGWIAALDKLGPKSANSPALVLSARTGPATARAESVAAFGKWTTAPLPTLFDFGSCFEDGWTRGDTDAVRLAVDETGHPTRCEVEPDPRHPNGNRLGCYCNVARAAHFDAGDASRRLEVRVVNDPHPSVDVHGVHYLARLQALHASDGGLVGPHLERANPRLAACVAASASVVPALSHLRLDVDPMGVVTKVAMDGTNDAFRACCGASLRGTAMPCGRAGAYQVDAELAVGAQR